MQRNAELCRHSFAFANEIVEELSCGGKTGGRSVMEQRQCTHGIGGGVEDELGPLRAPRILQWDGVHAGAGQEAGKLFDLCIRCLRRLERSNPGVALDVEADVSGRDQVPCRKGSPPNDVAHVLRAVEVPCVNDMKESCPAKNLLSNVLQPALQIVADIRYDVVLRHAGLLY